MAVRVCRKLISIGECGERERKNDGELLWGRLKYIPYVHRRRL